MRICDPLNRLTLIYRNVFILHSAWTSRILSLSLSPVSSAAQAEVKNLSESRAELETRLDSTTSTVAILQTEKEKLQTDVQESKKEQDDLLMLLADQDQKITSLKKRLKELGETVEKLLAFSKITSIKCIVFTFTANLPRLSKHKEEIRSAQ